MDRKQHWETIYQTKKLQEVSWFQPIPVISLEFINKFDLKPNAKIIDIGGGDSFFADHLLELGYQDITVLDISSSSLERAKLRLGDRAHQVKWIVADASSFNPTEKYDFWHDRAAFHFLSEETEIENYLKTAWQSLNHDGILIIGTFSEQGPTKCSGIEIKQYSENSMADRLKSYFTMLECKTVDHRTPSGGVQNFVFCSFKKQL
jgi:ubiquinone/menaquinone biosynthesis C-methylase UbiE